MFLTGYIGQDNWLSWTSHVCSMRSQFPQGKLIGGKLDCSDVAVALNQAKKKKRVHGTCGSDSLEAKRHRQLYSLFTYRLTLFFPLRLGDIQLNQALQPATF